VQTMSDQWNPPIEFDARVVHLDGQVVVAVRGQVDVATCDGLWETVGRAIHLSPQLVLDLSETTFMGSAGLAVIVRALKQVQADGGSVVLRSPRAIVVTALQVTGLDQVVTVEW
jgi:anti-anti-sigma factor